MTMTSSRRAAGRPSLDIARGLGLVLVASAQLARVAAEVAAASDQPEPERLDTARTNWCETAADLLDLRTRIEAAAGSMSFTGSAGEHLSVTGRGDIVIPADAGYLAVLATRMDRHARVGRMFAVAPV